MPSIARLDGFRLRLALAMRQARRLAQADPEQFARSLRMLLDTDDEERATGDAVVAWEAGLDVPSAAVLLAAAAVARVEVEVLLHRPALIARVEQLEERLRRQAEQVRDLRQQLACS
jgi:transcriptional regulator with XRE-family HTH domain